MNDSLNFNNKINILFQLIFKKQQQVINAMDGSMAKEKHSFQHRIKSVIKFALPWNEKFCKHSGVEKV